MKAVKLQEKPPLNPDTVSYQRNYFHNWGLIYDKTINAGIYSSCLVRRYLATELIYVSNNDILILKFTNKNIYQNLKILYFFHRRFIRDYRWLFSSFLE
jgi:hypothetical protein